MLCTGLGVNTSRQTGTVSRGSAGIARASVNVALLTLHQFVNVALLVLGISLIQST